MSNAPAILQRLTQFQERDLFSNAAWEARGLNPSASELSGELNIFFHEVARELTRLIAENAPNRRLKATFIDALDQLPKGRFDTEEREFIAELFAELAAIVSVDIRRAVSRWLYGPILTALLTIAKLLRRPERVVATRSQPCRQCNTSLQMQILRTRKDFPDTSWLIVRCKACGELNLLEPGPGVGQFRYVDCEGVEILPKEEFTTHEQALTRLEQIKYFRK
ncbi:MAG TPA: hypothetical protein VGS79_10380 [Puia sp.]|nr:hypothetical protein [Puia sp.]